MTGDVPQNLAPMLVSAGPLPTPDEDFAHEIKWDGGCALSEPDSPMLIFEIGIFGIP